MIAYVGPGAGLALAGSFFTLFVALFTAVLLLVTWPVRKAFRCWRSRQARRRAAVRRVVVLGLDGLDPNIVEAMMAAGELPHLKRLQESGTYRRLQTTWPPLSPVAWSSFSTGVNPGKHAIFDFVRCNLANYEPEIATVRVRNQPREISGLRKSRSFWQVLSENGIYSAVLRVPVSFPPEKFYGVQLSAASVPDLRGTQGTYTHFIEATNQQGSIRATHGRTALVQRRGDTIHAMLPGPPHPLRADRAEMMLPLKVVRNAAGEINLLIPGQRVLLVLNEFTPWVRVTFSISHWRKVIGVCQFLLKSWEAPFSLYCSPLNLDPVRPAMPISSPAAFSRYLAAKQGVFATLGLAEDTGALSDGVLSEDQFLDQANIIHIEREEMFFDMLRRVKRGMVACVFDGPDRLQHMFWNDNVTARGNDFANVVREHYQQLDSLVGRTLEQCDRHTALVVLSDHGFSAFRRAVDLNAWLAEHGYLTWLRMPTPDRPTKLQDIDWSRTRAFAFGLTGLLLNVRGRQIQGIVEPGEEARKLTIELCEVFSGLIDPDSGETAILEVVPRAAVFHGPYVEQAPDMIVGYNRGYRVHWDTALGGSRGDSFSDNEKLWRGDHCQHPAVVPGVLFCNRSLRGDAARMIDVAPTVLDLLGVVPPSYIDGVSLRCDGANS